MKPTLNNATRDELKVLWKALFRTNPPDESQWDIWARMHDAETIREGLLGLAIKDRKLGGEMTMDYRIRFASSLMNSATRAKREALNKLKTPVQAVTVPAELDQDSRWNR
jgi:hypothetical protein